MAVLPKSPLDAKFDTGARHAHAGPWAWRPAIVGGMDSPRRHWFGPLVPCTLLGAFLAHIVPYTNHWDYAAHLNRVTEGAFLGMLIGFGIDFVLKQHHDLGPAGRHAHGGRPTWACAGRQVHTGA